MRFPGGTHRRIIELLPGSRDTAACFRQHLFVINEGGTVHSERKAIDSAAAFTGRQRLWHIGRKLRKFIRQIHKFLHMMEKLEIRGIHKSDIRHGFLRHTQRQLLLKILIRHIFYFHSDSILGVIEFQCKPCHGLLTGGYIPIMPQSNHCPDRFLRNLIHLLPAAARKKKKHY